MPPKIVPCCPVCRASFRGTRECSRCGADLRPLMVLRGKAYLLRRASREAIRSGDFTRAGELAQRAERFCGTETGRKLVLLAKWLVASRKPLRAGGR